jgi:hypothetical protein
MADGLKAVPLEQASPELKQQFVELLAEQAEQQKLNNSGHRCWFFIPTEAEMERMKKYMGPPNYDKCPKCLKGRIIVEVSHDYIGEWKTAVCLKKCGFQEDISDEEGL